MTFFLGKIPCYTAPALALLNRFEPCPSQNPGYATAHSHVYCIPRAATPRGINILSILIVPKMYCTSIPFINTMVTILLCALAACDQNGLPSLIVLKIQPPIPGVDSKIGIKRKLLVRST